MEALRQRRGTVRRGFTRTANLLDEALKVANPVGDDLAALLAQLEDKQKKLEDIEKEVLNTLINGDGSAEEYEQEYETAEGYTDRGTLLKAKTTRLLSRLDNELPSTARSNTDERIQADRRKYRLPEIKLKKFSGEPKDWLGFWGQFVKIHTDEELDDADKFQYLLQATVAGSKARELVESFPPTAGNYSRVVEHLRSRFGRDETLVEVYVRELLRLVLENAMSRKNKEGISQLYDILETQLRALESLGVTTDKYAAMLYPLLESCLPEDSLRAWERTRAPNDTSLEPRPECSGTQDRLTSLIMAFLRSEVEGEERIRIARAGFGLNQEDRRKPGEKKVAAQLGGDFPTAAVLYNDPSKGETNRKEGNCVFCGKGHLSVDCRQAARWSYEQKRRALIQKRCCFACLKTNHLARFCRNQQRQSFPRPVSFQQKGGRTSTPPIGR